MFPISAVNSSFADLFAAHKFPFSLCVFFINSIILLVKVWFSQLLIHVLFSIVVCLCVNNALILPLVFVVVLCIPIFVVQFCLCIDPAFGVAPRVLLPVPVSVVCYCVHTVSAVLVVCWVVSFSPIFCLNTLVWLHSSSLSINCPFHLQICYIPIGVIILLCLVLSLQFDRQVISSFPFLIVNNIPVICTVQLQACLFIFYFCFSSFASNCCCSVFTFCSIFFVCLSLPFLLYCFRRCSLILCCGFVDGIDVVVVDVV